MMTTARAGDGAELLQPLGQRLAELDAHGVGLAVRHPHDRHVAVEVTSIMSPLLRSRLRGRRRRAGARRMAPLEALRVHDRDRERHDRHRLMRERERERHLIDEREDAEHRLDDDRSRERERAGERRPSPHRARDVDRVQQRAERASA